MRNRSLFFAFLHSLGVAAYITLVAWFMTYAGRHFSDQDAGFGGGIAFLLLFVISAIIVSSLVLGRPIMLYLDGKKREAITFLAYTVGCLLIIAVIVFSILFALYQTPSGA